MPSRKDFAQRSRSRNAASPKRPAAKPSSRPAARAPKRGPWKLALLSLLALAGLIFLLNRLLDVEKVPTPGATPPPAANEKPAPKPAPAPKEKTQTKAAEPTRDSQALPPVKEQSTQAETPAVPPKPIAEEKPTGNKYEFYELLPKSEVIPAAVDEYKSTPRNAVSATRYLLQAGSFRDPGDAEKMRVQLLLQGLTDAHTSKTESSNGGTWYRVRVGPFDNRSQLNKAHDKLVRMNINPMQIRVN